MREKKKTRLELISMIVIVNLGGVGDKIYILNYYISIINKQTNKQNLSSLEPKRIFFNYIFIKEKND